MVNATTINVTTPVGVGQVDVVVQHPGGDQALANGFAYTPTLASLNVTRGPAGGGTPVVVTGTGFTDATGVTFGGTPGTAFSVVNVTTINVTTPAGGLGQVDVVVQHPGGNQTLANGFTYTATTAALTGTVTNDDETDIQSGVGSTIVLTLTDDTWAATVGGNNQITTFLIAGLTSAQSEATGWNAVVRAGLTSGNVDRTSATVVTITLPAFATYAITADETITVTIPPSALAQSTAVVVATPTFTVTNN